MSDNRKLMEWESRIRAIAGALPACDAEWMQLCDIADEMRESVACLAGASRETAGPTDEEVQAAAWPIYRHGGAMESARTTARSVLTDFLASRSGETGGRALEDVKEGASLRDADSTFVIWSRDHRAWWGPDRSGYFTRLFDAGEYTEEAARRLISGPLHRAGSAIPRDEPSDVAMTWREACTWTAKGQPDDVLRSEATPNPLPSPAVGDQETPQ